MLIAGVQKTTLLDFPGLVAATLFLGRCNLRCPFCQNSDLLEGDGPDPFSVDEVMAFLRKRRTVLKGVCITGGEPTLTPALEDLIVGIRDLGYKVKLDTNGTAPVVLRHLIDKKLLDYVAMDIKSGPSGYAAACGTPGMSLSPIRESVSLLMENRVPFEFRTTAVKGIHSVRDFEEIADWIAGPEPYFLQSYKDSERVLCPGYQAFSREELAHFVSVVKPKVPNTALRGVD